MTTNPDEEPNFVSLLMADGLRRRNVASLGLGPVHDKSSVPTQNVVTYAPSRENQLRLHTMNNVGQAMVIRLALDSKRSTAENDDHYGEYVDLCVLKHGSNGVLEVSPDFTNNRKPYTIELDNKETCEYWIEHVSAGMDYDEQLREDVMQNEVFARHVQVLRSEVGEDFERPPGRTFRLVLNGEIVSASEFDTYGTSLFIHYFVELPVGWSQASDENSDASGMTQTCKMAPIQGTDVAHFGHPFSLDLYYDINRLDSTTVIRDNLPKWPQIFFEVVSLDEWSRCRTEGYGYISIPVNAGSYDNVNVETWRPVLPGPITEMKRYFVGGTPELDDLSYCGTPASVSDSAILSRYGFRTMTSGKIKLRMYVMHQAKAFLTPTGGATSKMASKWKRHHLMDRLASATLFSSLSAVLEAFKKARERITQATEGYDVDTPVLA